MRHVYCNQCWLPLYAWGEQGQSGDVVQKHKEWHEDLNRRINEAAQVGRLGDMANTLLGG